MADEAIENEEHWNRVLWLCDATSAKYHDSFGHIRDEATRSRAEVGRLKNEEISVLECEVRGLKRQSDGFQSMLHDTQDERTALKAEVERLNILSKTNHDCYESACFRAEKVEREKVAYALALKDAREALWGIKQNVSIQKDQRGYYTIEKKYLYAVDKAFSSTADPTALLEAHDREVAAKERKRWADAFEGLIGVLRKDHIFAPGLSQAIADLRLGPLPENPLLEDGAALRNNLLESGPPDPPPPPPGRKHG